VDARSEPNSSASAKRERAAAEYPRLIGSGGRSRRPIITGAGRTLRGDIYLFLIDAPWWAFFSGLAVVFLLINLLFAWLYTFDPQGLSNPHHGSFADAFFFSVQTFTTLGYGNIAPISLYANTVSVIEAFAGVLNIALATGTFFARVSRPRALVLFSGPAVIAPFEGVPSLMFRVANQRGNQIMEAEITVSLAHQHITREGHVMRRFTELTLIRNKTPLFALSWMVMHPITEHSPLHGATRESLIAQQAEIVVLLSGTDETYGEKIYARHSYIPHDIHWNKRFADILSIGPEGRRILDLRRFHLLHDIE
jgi:inward rectifier potassium channel